jgi:hypothetical protein
MQNCSRYLIKLQQITFNLEFQQVSLKVQLVSFKYATASLCLTKKATSYFKNTAGLPILQLHRAQLVIFFNVAGLLIFKVQQVSFKYATAS